MRLVLALAPLLLTASAAFADPPQTPFANAAEPSHRHHQMGSTHQLTPASYPAFHRDATTDSNCYYVFGDLHCDRIAKTPHK